MVDPRTALLFVLQPVFSGLLAFAMVAGAVFVFRPKRPWVRATLWLLPALKIAVDLASASPAYWIGSQGVAPEGIQRGSRVGTISVGLSGEVPVIWGAARLEYSPNDVRPKDVGTQVRESLADPTPVMSARDFGLLHPGDLLYAKLGRAGTFAVVLSVLLVGLAKALLRTARLFAFRRWLARSVRDARDLTDVAPAFAALRTGFPPPRILVVPKLAVPFATGFLSPRILVPQALVETLSADELAALLAHELAHLRRADPLVRVVLGYVRDLFWYVPGLGGAITRFQAEREADCDDAARGEDAGDELAHALLKTHDWVRAEAPAIPGLAPSWAPAAVESSTLAMRLQRLVAPPRESSRAARVLATLAWGYAALVILKSSLAGLS